MRVLFFSPYILWRPHVLWEKTLAFALQQAGASVLFVQCGGLPDCGQARKSHDREEDICLSCQRTAHSYYKDERLAYAFLQISEERKNQIRAWAENLAGDALRAATWNGLPLGEWVFPEIVAYFFDHHPDTTAPDVATVYRDHLYGAAVTAEALPSVLQEFTPDVALMLNGSFFMHRVVFELLRKRGVRVLTHERGLMDNAIMLNENEAMWTGDHFANLWAEWRDIPLTVPELRKVEKTLNDRRKGQNMGWLPYSPEPQDRAAVLSEMGLPPDKPVALMPTSYDYETAFVMMDDVISQDEWTRIALDWFAAHPEYTLVVRCHPGDTSRPDYEERVQPVWEALRATLPDHIRMVLPHEPISTYTLMDIAQCCLSYGSTVGIEAACQGLPVLHGCRSLYRGAGFTIDVTDAAELPAAIERALQMPRSIETQRLAWRFTYHYFFGQNFPMDKVTVPQDNYFTAQLNYTDTRELAPGKDAQVDRLVGYILGTNALYPPPNTLRRAYGAKDENRFFKERRLSALLSGVQQRPDRADLLFQAAEGLRDLGLFADAMRTYSAVLERTSEDGAAWRGLGDCCVRLKDYGTAVAAYRLALEKDPQDDLAQDALRQLEPMAGVAA